MWTSPDAVQLMVDRLDVGAPVAGRAGTEAAFVKVLRTGGPRATPVSDQPQLTFEAYAKRPSLAYALADKTRAGVHAMAGLVIDGTQVYKVVELSGPSDLPDPLLPDYSRYTFTLAVHLRGRTS